VIRHSETRVVPFGVDVMYGVVADVERYPQFLPWVHSLAIKSREVLEETTILLAEMTVGYGPLHETYTSRVILDPARSIDVIAIEGPFRVLENHWCFTPADNGCRVEFSIVFEFKNRLLDAVAGTAFAAVMRQMASAFEERARALSNQSLQKG
jgi:coenzyme Q-binding protein COQ10